MKNRIYSGKTAGVLGKTVKGDYVNKNCEHYIITKDGVYNVVISGTVKEIKEKKNLNNK